MASTRQRSLKLRRVIAEIWYNNWYQLSQEIYVVSITASEARKNLFPLIEQVNENREPIEITSKRGDAVLMSRADSTR